MAVNTTIHKIDTDKRSCIVTVYDEDILIIDRKNIGLDLNPDGTANTQSIIQKLKDYVFNTRLHNLEKTLYPDID